VRSVRRPLVALVATALASGTVVALAAPATAAGTLANAYGLTSSDHLVSFQLEQPGASPLTDVMITGLLAGDDVLGVDVRPATGQLYALVRGSSSDRLYVVDPAGGAATQVGSALSTRLAGTSFGFDFNPVVDRIRIVSDSDQNLRVHPDTGAIAAVDGTLAYKAGDANAGANPNVTAAGYENNVPGGDPASTPPTDLFGIDTDRDALVRQDPPNAGTLNTVGALNVGDVTSVSGLDVAGSDRGTSKAYAVLVVNGEDALYTVNTDTGAATKVGAFPATASVEDLAIADPRFVIDATASATEGGTATVTVRRVGDTRFAGTVNYATADGSAAAGADYTAASGTLSFGAGETSKTFTVATTDDTATEGAELFSVLLSSPTGQNNTVGRTTGSVTVVDNEPGAGYGLTTGNEIVTFSVNTPGATGTPVSVTGLQAGEDLVGIDVRPANGELYAVGSTSRLYVVNPGTGVATQRGEPLTTALSGTSFGVDFNPSVDRLRIVSNTGQNLRVNPDTGATTVDGPLAYDAADAGAGTTPVVTGAAYTNNTAAATPTVLIDIDAGRDVLVRQSPPNDGKLVTIGALGVALSDTSTVGIDISSQGGAAFAALTPTGTTGVGLYRIDTATGAARLLGLLGNSTIEDIALASVAPQQAPPSPSPSTPPPSRPTLTLTVRTPAIPAGTTATLVATGAANALYQLQCYTRPSTTYVTARSGAFNAAGDPVTFTLALGRNTRCFIQYAATPGQGFSPSVVVNVRTVLSLSTVRNGVRSYTFQGRNLPRVAGQLITLYRVDAAGNEIRTANLVTDSSGIYRVARRFTGTGTFQFKVRTSQTNDNAAGVSNTITVRVS
jgi:hypothetical protein